METVRWGIISTADIGMAKVTPAIQRAANCDVIAIASRGLERAQIAAEQLGIANACGSYEELLDRDDVDAVYIPLPNDMHAEWVVKAAEAGKHILCEKPLAMTSMQAQDMVDTCAEAGVKLQEAFMYRHHPTWVKAVKLARSGAIGDLRAVQSWFSYYNDDPDNIRNKVENGGGAVMDIGCYNINLSRLLFDGEPTRVESMVHRDPVMGIDILSSGVLEFGPKRQSSFTCTIRSEGYQRVHIFGTGGRIEIEVPFNIPTDVETRIHVTVNGDGPGAPPTETLVFPPADQYEIQAELFAQSIIDDTPVPVDPSDAVANMRVIEAILTPNG